MSSSSSSTMISVPSQAATYREILFRLEKPVQLTQQEFDEFWPLVDTVWTKIGGNTTQRHGTIQVQHYECRLRKSKKTGTNVARNGGRVVKPRMTAVRIKDLCQVRMKITRTIPSASEPVMVFLERKDDAVHTHSIEEAFRLCGLPSIVKRAIAAEANKNYSPAQIFHALKGSGSIEGSQNLEAAGGVSLKRQDIINAKRGIRSDNRFVLNGAGFRTDIDEARALLTSKGWLFEEFSVLDSQKELRWGMVFAHPSRLEILRRRGYLTQFDSTHKMNRWKHNMFSFLVRDEHGIAIPTAHCVVECENADALSRAMQAIKAWSGWHPRYVLTGDSAIEQLAVRKTFRGSVVGEPEVSHILCLVHTTRTLQQQFKTEALKPVLQLLSRALHTYTGAKCRELCEEAVRVAPPEKKGYVQRHWLETAGRWAMYARQHSPLLLQICTTNSSEAWHRKLKSAAGVGKGKVATFGIHGMVLHVMAQPKEVASCVTAASTAFSNKVHAICHNEYPAIARFPAAIQQLLIPEIWAVEERIAAGKAVPFDLAQHGAHCKCQFARSYLLPCRHIFHLHSVAEVLTRERWQRYVDMFGEGGLEVYETMGAVDAQEQLVADTDEDRVDSLLDVRDVGEQLQQQLYAVHAVLKERGVSDAGRRAVVAAWVDHIRLTVAPLADLAPEQIVDRNGPWEV